MPYNRPVMEKNMAGTHIQWIVLLVWSWWLSPYSLSHCWIVFILNFLLAKLIKTVNNLFATKSFFTASYVWFFIGYWIKTARMSIRASFFYSHNEIALQPNFTTDCTYLHGLFCLQKNSLPADFTHTSTSLVRRFKKIFSARYFWASQLLIPVNLFNLWQKKTPRRGVKKIFINIYLRWSASHRRNWKSDIYL